MANAAPLTEAQLQDLIHSTLEGDTDTPSTGDDDYLLRRALINRFIVDWENERGVFWNELWATDTSQTIATSDSSYDYTSLNMKFPGGYVRLVDSDGNEELIPVIKPHEAQNYTTEQRIAYFTGNPATGYTLELLWTPAAAENGKTIKFDYYKFATKLEAVSDEIEMSNPLFVVDSVVAEIRQREFRQDSYVIHAGRAQSWLTQMKEQNDMAGNYQNDQVFDNSEVPFGV